MFKNVFNCATRLDKWHTNSHILFTYFVPYDKSIFKFDNKFKDQNFEFTKKELT